MVVCVFLVELLDEGEVDFLLLLIIKIFKGDGKVDAGLNGYVKGTDTIGGEDEDAVVVFEDAEEDCRISAQQVRFRYYGFRLTRY